MLCVCVCSVRVVLCLGRVRCVRVEVCACCGVVWVECVVCVCESCVCVLCF